MPAREPPSVAVPGAPADPAVTDRVEGSGADGLLPPHGPASLLVGSPDAALTSRTVDLLAPGSALSDHLVAVVDAEDARASLARAVAGTPPAGQERVRVAVTAPAGPAADAEAALLAPTLAEWGHRLADAELLPGRSPHYGVRYQPIVDLTSGATVGFEALLRVEAGDGEVDVELLFHRAARGGWLAELDRLGRTVAVQGVGPWLGAGLLFLNVAAPAGTFDVGALQTTLEAARQRGLDPDQLVFEATERNRYSDLAAAAAQLRPFRDQGVRLAIDDVGSGWASLEVVTRLRPDVLKVSAALVGQLPGVEAAAAVGAVVNMAHQLGTWVVVEGVETRQQAAALRSLGADWAQGHLFGHPVERQAGRPESGQ